MPIGSAGPTTSGRMDRYTPALYAAGVRATIGKGFRSREVREALTTYNGIYLAAVGGSGALLSRRIASADIVAFEHLGPEAIYRLVVREFPAIVVNDCNGGDLYESARHAYELTPPA
jgi:fumarate hydratase subunit beta